jgi:hypothetical protein
MAPAAAPLPLGRPAETIKCDANDIGDEIRSISCSE